MQRKFPYLMILFLLLSACTYSPSKQPSSTAPTDIISKNTNPNFITVQKETLYLKGQPYHFIGTNYWYGSSLGSKSKSGDRQRLVRELDQLKEMGVNNLRIMASSEGPDSEPWRMSPSVQPVAGEINEEALDGLDFLMNEMKKRDMFAVLVLNNFWHWSGGMAQYLSWSRNEKIPYPPPAKGGSWGAFMDYAAEFYSDEPSKKSFDSYIKKIVLRKNSYTNADYKDDSSIMSWELANEPRSQNKTEDYLAWIKRSSSLIKSLDPNHLVTVGSEGTFANGEKTFEAENRVSTIDYLTFHLWVENWSWYNPTKAHSSYESALKKSFDYIDQQIRIAFKIKKPIVFEEFGIARDDRSYAPKSSVTFRDKFYEAIFKKTYDIAVKNSSFAGVNFWAWSGSGRPSTNGGTWKTGDAYIGDPPHENQGWYSVYDEDESTNKIISYYATKFSTLK